MKLITAIVTTYKREPYYVLRALKSIKNQTWSNIEIIVVDDSPSDYALRNKVKEEIEAFDHSIKYIAHEENRGACVARNTGLRHATGYAVAYLDDDDEWLPEKIEKLIKQMEVSDAALVYSRYYIVNDMTNDIHLSQEKLYKGKVYEQLILNNFIGSTSYPLIKKSVLEKIGGFDPEMMSAQDYDVWLRIAQVDSVDYVDEPLVYYHIHDGEQITSNPLKKIAGLERLNYKNRTYLKQNRATFWIRNMKIIPFYSLANQKRKAFKTWIKCVIKCPDKIVENIKYLFWVVGLR